MSNASLDRPMIALAAALALSLAGCGGGAEYVKAYMPLDAGPHAPSTAINVRQIDGAALDGLLASEYKSHLVLGKSVVEVRKADPAAIEALARQKGASDVLWWQIYLGKRQQYIDTPRSANTNVSWGGGGAKGVTMAQDVVQVHVVLLLKR